MLVSGGIRGSWTRHAFGSSDLDNRDTWEVVSLLERSVRDYECRASSPTELDRPPLGNFLSRCVALCVSLPAGPSGSALRRVCHLVGPCPCQFCPKSPETPLSHGRMYSMSSLSHRSSTRLVVPGVLPAEHYGACKECVSSSLFWPDMRHI